MMKLITLNIEKDKHFDRFIPFLRKENADVVCLQEVFEKDFEMIKQEVGMEGKFFGMTRKMGKCQHTISTGGPEGIAILTNLLHSGINVEFYKGEGTVPECTGTSSQDRGIAYCTVEKGGGKVTIGTTHFTWTPGGSVTEEQKEDCKKLLKITEKFPKLILCGDFNAPRGRDTFTRFTEHLSNRFL